MFQTDNRNSSVLVQEAVVIAQAARGTRRLLRYYKIRPLPASFGSLPRLHSMNRERDSLLLKEALTIRFLNGSSMDVVLRLIHDCIGALHKRHRKEKEKLNP